MSFLLALKRFVAANGAVEKIISDNALCFSKADKLHKHLRANLKDPSIQNYFGQIGIRWTLNTPKATWYGGHFERLIGTYYEELLMARHKAKKVAIDPFYHDSQRNRGAQ